MAKKVRVRIGDQEVDAMEMDFQIKREEWNEYELVDGGRVKVKTTVHKILRVLDQAGKPSFDPDGEPAVIVRSRVDVSSS